MTWKDFLSEPNTRVTVVKDGAKLEEELQDAMDAILLIEEIDLTEVPVAIKVELLGKDGECEEWLFPMKWYKPQNEVKDFFGRFKLCKDENVAAKATIAFPKQIEQILLVCETELNGDKCNNQSKTEDKKSEN